MSSWIDRAKSDLTEGGRKIGLKKSTPMFLLCSEYALVKRTHADHRYRRSAGPRRLLGRATLFTCQKSNATGESGVFRALSRPGHRPTPRPARVASAQRAQVKR